MSSRDVTPSLYRTATQLSIYQQVSVSVRSKRGLSFNRDYYYKKVCTFFRLVRHAVRVWLIVRKYAIESSRNNREQLYNSTEILFDLSKFRRPVEETIGRDIRTILKSDPATRTEDDIRMIAVGLGQTVSSFTEFPLQRQYALARVAILEEFERGRVILREGHVAEKFYLIVDGITDVYKLRENPQTHTFSSRLVAVLKKGSSFGEVALINAHRRTATVCCQTDVSMISIEREDFIKIFMAKDAANEPDFITFLRQLPEFRGFPIDKIPHDNPRICQVVYYRMGTLMSKDSNEDEWIYIIRTGSCRVIKALTQVTPKLVTRKKTKVIYDHFNTQRPSQYSIEALGTMAKPKSPVKAAKCYTEIEQIREKSVFGLVSIVFGQLKNALSVTLISDGAECIRIRKNFFIKMTPQSLFDRLRREVRPYVTDEDLQKKLQREVDWTAYKHLLVKRIYERNARDRLITFNY
ncbi:unnamed protein product [Rotaria magnacalcarata]|uniref:Cyclic nucleotide-binding domain-containing protein n=3 Tax=Rotaria magnacalcarata TaxID=392030 RepID=A0A816V7I2_9BILA|nr:unnamed protein product [Rotaria magnacalcarata]CAF2164861.1 unnamed protein product [Rotaria magnacalcarata]